MAPPNYPTLAEANWAVDRATGLPEVWALIAKSRGVVGAWQLMRVCRAARAGAREFLRTLPGLVVCGGFSSGVRIVSDVWRLDLATMRWEPMPALVTARYDLACCAVRGALVVLGGYTPGGDITSRVEILSSSEEGGGAFADLPPLSRGRIEGAAAIAVDESDSAAGQVLVLGGAHDDNSAMKTVKLVDLATGACAQQPDLLHSRRYQLGEVCVYCGHGLHPKIVHIGGGVSIVLIVFTRGRPFYGPSCWSFRVTLSGYFLEKRIVF
jgi:hypothetical protein